VVPGGQAAEMRVVGMTDERKYYSMRTGKNQEDIKLDLLTLKRLFGNIFTSFVRVGDFEEAFGQQKPDRSFSGGIVGADIEAFFLRRLHKENLWPIEEKIKSYSEDDVFDVIELLYDVVSERYTYKKMNELIISTALIFQETPVHIGYDKKKGRERFYHEINEILGIYAEGYILSDKGEILLKGNFGLDTLLDQEISVYDPKNVDEKVKNAVFKFRRHRATVEDKREAVRTLADVLEFLRPEIKKLPLTKDEGDLFNIANNFGIRHHNTAQKTEYDQDVYLEWIFYSYLSTIHLSIRIIKKQNEK
jgi:hypothetical protein